MSYVDPASSPDFRMRTAELKKRLYAKMAAIADSQLMHAASIEEVYDIFSQSILYTLRWEAWGMEIEKAVQWPATWWDHLKEAINERFGWKLNVRYEVRNAWLCLPEAALHIQSHFPRCAFAHFEEPLSEE